ncbi:hypothetical protein [Parapedobacter sp. 10938]|uniref:hypothetical protein n=1 Tax=Parapedobacter flavus TaxID=3110225 RepID=UPI002DB75395|nr:hypothetical protein [Parapedobacter sp. 10938]MEC3881278.1 hypothetical protein [Parapedobacter sp. 10938]
MIKIKACLLRGNPLPHAPQRTEATPTRQPIPSFVGSLSGMPGCRLLPPQARPSAFDLVSTDGFVPTRPTPRMLAMGYSGEGGSVIAPSGHLHSHAFRGRIGLGAVGRVGRGGALQKWWGTYLTKWNPAMGWAMGAGGLGFSPLHQRAAGTTNAA